MRVLLVQPNQEHTRGFQQMGRLEPLGLEMIAGGLMPEHEVALLDLRLQPDGLRQALLDYRPDLVGVTCNFTTDVYQTLEVTTTVRQIAPDAYIVVGGHHATLRPGDFLHPSVDGVVLGEGEFSTRELVDCLTAGHDPAQVPGLALNQPHGQLLTQPRPLIEDLDTLPYPARSITQAYRQDYQLTLTRPLALLETMRGCPFHCRFCAVWRFHRGKVRSKSPQRVLRELNQISEPNVLFTDDNFLANVGRAKEIGRLIEESGIRKQYTIQARSDAIARHPEVISQWRRLGLTGVFIGFEKPNQKGLDTLNKHNSLENNEAALQILREHGIEPTASFIVDPDYDRDDFAELWAYVRRLRLRWPAFTVLTPLPGTQLFDDVREHLTTDDYELFDLLHAVVPTRLPLEQFYAELAGLWRRAYPRWELALASIYLSLREIGHPGQKAGGWRRTISEGRRLTQAETYLQDIATALRRRIGERYTLDREQVELNR